MTTARNYIILLGWLAVMLIELAFTKSPTNTP
jgi:hypothetical protein